VKEKQQNTKQNKKNKKKNIYLFVCWCAFGSFGVSSSMFLSAVFNLRRSLLVSNWTASKDTGIRARARQWQIENCGKYTHLRLWSPCSHAHSSSTPICINFSLWKEGKSRNRKNDLLVFARHL
jgi:hypothetical protein